MTQKPAPAKPAGPKGPQAPQVDETPIEDQILALPQFQGEKADSPRAKILVKFFDRVAPKLEVGATAHDILSVYADIEVSAEKVAACLKRNPYYEYQFLKVIQATAKRSEIPKTEVALVLLGMQNSRNMLLALQLQRAVTKQHPVWGADGKLQVNPGDMLKTALKLEEYLRERKHPFAEVTFNAGVMYDLLALIVNDLAEDKKKALSFLDSVFNKGLKCGEVGLALEKVIPDFQLKRYLFSACLLHDVGKVIFAALEPSYMAFNEELVKRGLSRPLRHYVETKKYGVSHNVLGALACEHFSFFKKIRPALMGYHAPMLLKAKAQNQLASAVCLATNITNKYQRPKDHNDPVLSEWKGIELAGFKMDLPTLFKATSKMS